METDLGIDLGVKERYATTMTVFMNILFILITGIWFVRFFIEMGMSKEHRICRFFQGSAEYKGESLTKKDIRQVLLFALAIRLLVYFAGIFIYMVHSHVTVFSWNDFRNLWN